MKFELIKKMNLTTKKKWILIGILAVIAILLVWLIISLVTSKKEVIIPNEPIIQKPVVTPIIKKYFSTDDRAFAVMIDNEGVALSRQSGLIKAEIIYEILVEGGETRLMAIFKDKLPDTVGPIRSARDYFAKYAREYDAVFVHLGGSPSYYSNYGMLNLDTVDGLKEKDLNTFWRSSSSKTDWQNCFSDSARLKQSLVGNNYSDKSTTTVFTYADAELDLENAKIANNVSIKYSGSKDIKYKYNEEQKNYTRFVSGKEHKDVENEKQICAKNIIVQFVNVINTNDSAGRLNIEPVGAGKGYYITNGKYVEFNWKKPNDITMTQYRDLDGNEIEINNGQTWVHIVPLTSQYEIN